MVDGDEEAFEQFSNNYIPALYRFAQRRLSGDRDLVSDLVQSTLCKAIAKLDTYRGEAALMTWLCTCCRNEIAGHFRKQSRSGQEINMGDDEELAADASFKPVIKHTPEQAFLRTENSDLVHEVLDRLPPRHGIALEWKYIEDLTVKEIASRLDLSPKAAESLLTRARASFREGYSHLVYRKPLSPDGAGDAKSKRIES
jgi:RNA polymerase sigma-70 factor (ECF subfamily)